VIRLLNYLFCLFFMVACSEVKHEKFPGGHGRTTDMRNAQATQAVLGGIDPLNNPLEESDPRTAQARGASKNRIAGTVRLAEGLEVKDGMSFFIAARPLAGGPPMAVKRLGRVEFPYKFELTEEDRMMANTRFEGEVFLTLRLDQDGNPLSREVGDIGVFVETRVGVDDLDLTMELEDN
jgi:hypothetical protein